MIAAAKYKNLATLIEKLTYPAESKEFRFKIVGVEDFKSYGQNVLEAFKSRAVAEGLQLAAPNFEGVRINFDGGWALLRMSLHDPNMPLNVESDAVGGCAKIVATIKKLIAGFDKLDTSALDK